MSETINARAAASSLVTGDKIPVWSLAAASGRSATLELVFNLIRDTYRATNITVTGNRVFEGSITLPARSVAIAAIDATGTPGVSTYLRGDGVWSSPSGAGDVVGPASATTPNFASFGDATGKLLADSGYNPASFATPGHTHTEAGLVLADNTTGNASTGRHGFLVKLSGMVGQYLTGTGTWATPSGGAGDVSGPGSAVLNNFASFASSDGKSVQDSGYGASSFATPGHLTDISTINATGTPSSANFLRGDGTWTAPAGSGDVVGPASAVTNNFTSFADETGKLVADSGYGPASFATPTHTHTEAALSLSDNTTANASTGKHGLLPKLDGESGHFLNGARSWATPSGGSGSTAYHYASPATADTTWTITHSLSQKYVIVVCAVGGVQVIPSEVEFTSDSVVTITWASAVTGNAVVIG